MALMENYAQITTDGCVGFLSVAFGLSSVERLTSKEPMPKWKKGSKKTKKNTAFFASGERVKNEISFIVMAGPSNLRITQ